MTPADRRHDISDKDWALLEPLLPGQAGQWGGVAHNQLFINAGDESHKRGLNTKLHLAVDAHGVPVRINATEGTRADCSEAASLIEGIDAEHLIADKGYDSDTVIRPALRDVCRICGKLRT